MRAILTIAGNTLGETIRQNVFGVVVAAAAALIMLSPMMAMFTFLNSGKLVQDMGLATILLTGLLLGVLGSASVISREIEGRTALTVLSKPVGRFSFVIGKYLGIAGAVTVASFILTVILLLMYRFGVRDYARAELDWPVVAGIGLSFAATMLVSFFQNYFFGKPFLKYSVQTFALFMGLCLLVFSFWVTKHHSSLTTPEVLEWRIARAAFLTLLAVLILVAVSVAASTRGNVVAALVTTFLFFLGGMLNDYLFGRFLGDYALAEVGYRILPNLQVFWVSEALITPETTIPNGYLLSSAAYAAVYIGAVLCAAMLLFARREIRD